MHFLLRLLVFFFASLLTVCARYTRGERSGNIGGGVKLRIADGVIGGFEFVGVFESKVSSEVRLGDALLFSLPNLRGTDLDETLVFQCPNDETKHS